MPASRARSQPTAATTRAFEVWDVFTDRLHGGNPLAVIPDGRGLSGAQMKALAREFNLSETVFVLPPEDPAHAARLRIFDPAHELPFAGHPTLGAVICLAARGDVFGRPVGPAPVVEEGVGPIACTVAQTGGVWQASFVATAPFHCHHRIDPATMAACLGLPQDAIRSDTHSPLMIDKGLPFAAAELSGRAALQAAAPDTAAMRRAGTLHPPPVGSFAIGAYVRTGATGIALRMFDPLAGIPEDPATGSLAAALAALLCDLGGAPVELDIAQGGAIGRPSRIRASALGVDGSGPVRITGQAVRSMAGHLQLPRPANSG
jgi:trans-2,3-dihydro-3-hydroxyanthranilate isomerase